MKYVAPVAEAIGVETVSSILVSSTCPDDYVICSCIEFEE